MPIRLRMLRLRIRRRRTPKPPHSAATIDGSIVIHGSGTGSGNKDAVNSILNAQQQRPGGSGGSVATIGGQSSQQVSKEEEAANKEWIESGKKDEDMEKFKDVVDPEDVEMLEDLITTCINNALKQVDEAQAQSLGKYNIPGLM